MAEKELKAPEKAINPIKEETVDIPMEAKEQLMGLVVEEAMKTPIVQSFIKGIVAGLGIKGNYMLRYSDLKFIKKE